ncbi:MAG: STAS domain-containing protein [Roseiflexus sp.]|nr:STAS domain-containing protein [Roseiflexus sp.]MCS7290222.1 STAS domain-containing protein [Roseiflexus sp.]MDW8233622.1 histidine kinase N-terminal 7TM domain-containing protein [Roseiflexaceae bacterium]
MNLILILLTLVVLTASGVYVLLQDWRAVPNRLFIVFASSMVMLTFAAAVRLTSRNPQETWFISGMLAPLLAASSWLLIWLILALFIPQRYAQPSVRWMLAAPYLLIIALLTLDWYGGLGIVWRDVVRSDAGAIVFSRGPAYVPILVLYLIGGMVVPLAFLVTIAVRYSQQRAPALWLTGGVAISYAAGLLSGTLSLPVLNYVSLLPLQLTFAWVTLRYQMFRPSSVALRTAIEHLPDGVVVLDAQRRARFANRAAQQLAPLANVGDIPFEEALARAGFYEHTTSEDQRAGLRRFQRDGEVAATLVVSEAAIEGDRGSASVVLLRDMTAAERQKAALASSRAALEERTAELERSLKEIQERDALITRLTLPFIPLGDGVLAMPLIGAFDSARCETLVTLLLSRIEERNARMVLLDLTGITSFDKSLALALRQAVDGARLMGAQIALCGVRPDIAESIVHEHTYLKGVHHFATMQEGVAAVLGRAR